MKYNDKKCFITIRKSSNPNIKIHAFGMTDFDLLEKYQVNPKYTLSSSFDGIIEIDISNVNQNYH